MHVLNLSFLIIQNTEIFLKNSFFLNSNINVVSITVFNFKLVYKLFQLAKKKLNSMYYRCLLLDTTQDCFLLSRFCTTISCGSKDYLLVILFKYEDDLFNLLKIAAAMNSATQIPYEHFFITSLKVRNYAYLCVNGEQALSVYARDHLLFLFFTLRQYLNSLNSFFINVQFNFSFTELYLYII